MQTPEDNPSNRRKFHEWQEAKMAEYDITGSDLVHVTGSVRRARFKINGATIRLSGRKAIVFTILAAACSIRPGATVTKERLIDVVEFLNQRGAIKWKEPNAITICQAVCLLRQALEAAGWDPKLIETTKGGYRLNTPNALVDESIMGGVPPMNGPGRG